MIRQIITGFVVIAALLGAQLNAHAQSLFEKLVNPGDVIEGHAKYEKTCESCHEPFSKQSQRRLCLDCHKDIAGDISQSKGLHGKRSDIGTAECKTCHTDHKGRAVDIVQFDAGTFNHAFTDFELKSAHKAAPCAGCHAKNEKHRKAAHDCNDCHKKDDVHKGALSKECASCHSEDTWRKTKTFDHTKTKFLLTGAHKEVQCAVCHAGERYKDIPHSCNDCHKIQDVHGGKFGAKCATCHATSKWTTILFDHGKATKFVLNGAHKPAKCTACHKGIIAEERLPKSCIGCHKADDAHKGQLGQRCESCHNETNWRQKVKFDHEMTSFPLIGLHAAVPCEECHQTTAYKDTPKSCAACHKDQHHEGRLGPACARCHNPNGWALWQFNHSQDTKFPLTGAHAGLQCHACHTTRSEGKVTASAACSACHAADDAHRGTFGRDCEKCHSTTSFREGLKVR